MASVTALSWEAGQESNSCEAVAWRGLDSPTRRCSNSTSYGAVVSTGDALRPVSVRHVAPNDATPGLGPCVERLDRRNCLVPGLDERLFFRVRTGLNIFNRQSVVDLERPTPTRFRLPDLDLDLVSVVFEARVRHIVPSAVEPQYEATLHPPALGLAHRQRLQADENQTWTTRYRGELLIHASEGMTRGESLTAGVGDGTLLFVK
ncbi:hypothetical protein J7E62_32140 [Variovorax paradoxus]|nr:hypothetical protein [Variovorax paradoxus]